MSIVIYSNTDCDAFDADVALAINSKKNFIDMTKYDHLPTKSAKIRAMNADGFSRSAIAHNLGVIYQHVRNVLTQPMKKSA